MVLAWKASGPVKGPRRFESYRLRHNLKKHMLYGIICELEACPSGLWCQPRKLVVGKLARGFESHRFCHIFYDNGGVAESGLLRLPAKE